MSLGLSRVQRPDGAHWLSGSVDEHADLQALLALKDPVLRLNLRGIKLINSLGVRSLINLARALGDRAVEFHDCPPLFIELVNTIPLAVGGTSKIARIKSLWIPMTCGEHPTRVTVPMAAIDFAGPEPTLPPFTCQTCFRTLEDELDTDLGDFLFFCVSEMSKGA